jgi:hypothetical protein
MARGLRDPGCGRQPTDGRSTRREQETDCLRAGCSWSAGRRGRPHGPRIWTGQCRGTARRFSMSPRRSVTRGTPDNRRCQRLRPVARPCRDEGLARRRILGGRAGAAGLSRALPARLYLSLPAPGLETPTARRCSRLRPHRETSSALKRAISPTCRPITRPSAVVGSNRGSAQTRWMQHERSPPRSKVEL